MLEPVLIHFTHGELTHTDTGLPNEPSVVEWSHLVRLVADILEPARELIGPMKINSGFRSRAVNNAVRGEPTSQHCRGLAADFVPMHMDIAEAFTTIKASSIPFNQLILENKPSSAWIHISCAEYGVTPRRECMKARFESGKAVYVRV